MNAYSKYSKSVLFEKVETYYKSYTDAVAAAIADMERRGYAVDPEETATVIGVNSKRPKEGDTTSWKVALYKKDDVEFKKAVNWLAVQVYNRGNRSVKPFELNYYATK